MSEHFLLKTSDRKEKKKQWFEINEQKEKKTLIFFL